MSVMTLDEARFASTDDLRADLIRAAARGQGPTFIAAKLDMLIAAVRAEEQSGQSRTRCHGGFPGGVHSYAEHGRTVNCPLCGGSGWRT